LEPAHFATNAPDYRAHKIRRGFPSGFASYTAREIRSFVMISFFKGLVPGILLTWIISGIVGSNGSKGGFLFIHQIYLAGNSAFSTSTHGFYWSWPLFIASTMLAFFIFKMLE
jgi:hypothetical protein